MLFVSPQLNADFQVKQQHLERNAAFLVDELKVVQGHEAPNRVFFVSAREALVSRVNQDKGTPTPSGQLLEGFQGRLFEFANFERKFEVILFVLWFLHGILLLDISNGLLHTLASVVKMA